MVRRRWCGRSPSGVRGGPESARCSRRSVPPLAQVAHHDADAADDQQQQLVEQVHGVRQQPETGAADQTHEEQHQADDDRRRGAARLADDRSDPARRTGPRHRATRSRTSWRITGQEQRRAPRHRRRPDQRVGHEAEQPEDQQADTEAERPGEPDIHRPHRGQGPCRSAAPSWPQTSPPRPCPHRRGCCPPRPSPRAWSCRPAHAPRRRRAAAGA